MTIQELLDSFEDFYDRLADSLSSEIIDNITSGEGVNKAIGDAFQEIEFENKCKDKIIETVIMGYLIQNKGISENKLEDIFLNQSWTNDGITLKDRIEYAIGSLPNLISTSINTRIINARLILDILRKNEKTLQDLVMLKARLNHIFADISFYPEQLDNIDVILMMTRKKILEGKDITSMNEELNNRLSTVITLAMIAGVYYSIAHRSKYNVMRIARSDTARSWYEGLLAKTKDEPDTFGYRWKLSPLHYQYPFDICDVIANSNVGYGKGVYPKNKLPRFPAHPHCKCSLTLVKIDDIGILSNNKFDETGMNKYINNLDKDKLLKLFTRTSLLDYRKTGNWQETVSGWGGFENPSYRV